MNVPDKNGVAYLESRAFLLLLLAVTLALGWILLPFYGTIMWGAIIALLFSPLYRRLLPHLKQRRTSAALLTLLIVLVIVIIPFALVTASLALEATQIYDQESRRKPGKSYAVLLTCARIIPNWRDCN